MFSFVYQAKIDSPAGSDKKENLYTYILIQVMNFMKLSPHWEANSCLTTQVILHLIF